MKDLMNLWIILSIQLFDCMFYKIAGFIGIGVFLTGWN
jgi:hypothetical protein